MGVFDEDYRSFFEVAELASAVRSIATTSNCQANDCYCWIRLVRFY